MKTKKLLLNAFSLMALFLLSTTGFSQVGIGTLMPNESAMLDVVSTTKGMLTPRMTSVERLAIANPVNGLLVYDTSENAFYFYKGSTWTKLDSSVRNNYKLVKSVADLSSELAAGGSTYKLNSNTLYEINGTITLTAPIDLNNAYIAGLDANEDILSLPGGIVFKGSTGGSIRNVTLKGAKAFEITGPGIATTSSLLVQNTIIDGMTNVGSIDGLGLFFGNIIQFLNNANGITYSNIGNLLLTNQAWFGNNSGTFEKFTGTFGLIEKVSGFSTVSGSAVALDVSTTGLAVGTGVLQATVFTGTTSEPSGYVKGYATGSYPGYKFSNAWTVDAPGVPREGDAEATGDINLDAVVGNGDLTSFTGTGATSRKKIAGTTTSNNLFRFTRDGNNRITYRGNKSRYFQVAGSVSYQGTADMTLILYIAKNGTVIEETKVYGKAVSGYFTNAGILALPIIGTVELKTNDYLEIWAERFSGSGNMLTVSFNLIAR
ncbi:hypothetical protein [Bizionia sp.]|uniref:hypothetical protein n=1 Tax=Bizionia sp. TaxID=1954480 RepID=UPI003A8E21FF